MEVIQDQTQIEKCHLQLQKLLQKSSTERVKTIVGHRGYSEEKEVLYSEEFDIWWDMGSIAEGNSGKRYWNAFGLGKPKNRQIQDITCEINYPLKGINKRIAACWVKDGNDIFLVHSGKIGGGRKGIGKSGFIKNYNGVFEEVEVEGLPNEITIIGNLKDLKLSNQISNFVHEAFRIKQLLLERSNTEEESSLNDPLKKIEHTFNEEFVGTKEYIGRKGKRSATANHGLVVNTLKRICSSKGFLVANDQQRDLYFYNLQSQIETVFEVKTSLKSQSIFTAVGQLYVNNIKLSPLPKMFYVIPEKPNTNLLETLKKLNIAVLVYHWENKVPIFENLDKLLEC